MNPITTWKAFAAALLVAWPLSASAIGTVSDGDVTFGYTFDFNSSFGNTVDTQFTGAAAGDLTWESWWFFRVLGATSETAFGAPDAEDYTRYGGSVGLLDWDDPGGAGLFSAALGFEVRDTGVDSGLLFQTMRITNTDASPLTISLFHYTDLDLSASFGGDSALLVANPDGIQIDTTDGVNFSPMIGYGADAFQITGWNALLRNLTDGDLDDFDDTGDGFGPGDVTAGFQWNVTIAAGGYVDFMTQFGGDTPLEDLVTSPVPEPGSAVLMGLGLIGLASSRRRDS